VDYSLLVTATTIGSTACAAVYAAAKLMALKMVLKDSKPGERAPLVEAVAELFRSRSHSGRTGSTTIRRRRTKAVSPAEPVDADPPSPTP
jgi:hypothetical protein